MHWKAGQHLSQASGCSAVMPPCLGRVCGGDAAEWRPDTSSGCSADYVSKGLVLLPGRQAGRQCPHWAVLMDSQ